MIVGGDAAVVDSTVVAGLEVKVRSQWAYARIRFLRHRLAMAGLMVSSSSSGGERWRASRSRRTRTSRSTLTNILHAPTTEEHHYFGRRDRPRLLQPGHLRHPDVDEVGMLVALVSSFIGLVVGAVAGYFGGRIDHILMRLTDLVLTLPALAILLSRRRCSAGATGKRRSSSLGFFWTTLARSCAACSSRCARRSTSRRRRRPARATCGSCSATSSRTPSGRSSSTGRSRSRPRSSSRRRCRSSASGSSRRRLRSASLVVCGQTNPQNWWLTIFPGLTIVLMVLCINFIGDGLRDAFDPTQRRMRA